MSFGSGQLPVDGPVTLSCPIIQVVAYTIMDIISKCVFSFMIVSAHDSLGSPSQAPAQSREYV